METSNIDLDNGGQYVRLSNVAKVLTTQSYKKHILGCHQEANERKFFIRREIPYADYVGQLGTKPDLDYVVFNSKVPITYISFILNSKYGCNSLRREISSDRIVKTSLDRIKATLIPINEYFDDCCYLEEIVNFLEDYYQRTDSCGQTKEDIPLLFLLRLFFRIKSYLILEMFKPEIFKEFGFSILNSWRIEREIMGDETPNLFLVHNLLKNLFNGANELTMDLNRLSVIGAHYDFSPIL